ncbi:HD domain-containing protein [Kibdelosporangium aridum]|uniref:HD domain-containing protein n=1 Tax=Kibdelosporangium aridum TaxID=2030 RepID=A0A1W2DNA2_KIBAR|nr:HD domain-containing protein [Kibdelosporangium aridum]SMC98980.1 HD domain-containing protein [Kibdelosporangium aridum]
MLDPPITNGDLTSVVQLGVLALAFGRVNRITFHEDGVTPESDTDHTVMLGLVACSFAARHLPHLDLGLIAQLALVHDVVEVYAGDTPTLRITTEQQTSKQEREHVALERIRAEFSRLPWLSTVIDLYENRSTPEARYVKAMDKLLPKITHIANGGRTLRDQGFTMRELIGRYERQLRELQDYAADFPPLLELRAELVSWVYNAVDLCPIDEEAQRSAGT